MKILIADTEWIPCSATVWRAGKQYVPSSAIDTEQSMIMLQWKWLGEKKVYTKSLPDFDNFNNDIRDDSALINFTLDLLDEADVVIGQNWDGFDNKMINAKALVYNYSPPSSYQTIDTYKEVKKIGRFNGNGLDYLSHLFFGEGKIKMDMGDFLGCAQGSIKAYKKMEKYGKKDVTDTEKLYLRLRPWIKGHLNVGLYDHEKSEPHCKKCGSTDYRWSGWRYNKTTPPKHEMRCKSCGGTCSWSQTELNRLNKKKMEKEGIC